MKYKTLTKEQILISLDRLTRFKPTKEKYLRVFFDIILGNIIEPKFKRIELENLYIERIRDLASEVINASITTYIKTLPTKADNSINIKLKDYENSIFNNDDKTQILLDNNINYHDAIHLIDETCVVNLR